MTYYIEQETIEKSKISRGLKEKAINYDIVANNLIKIEIENEEKFEDFLNVISYIIAKDIYFDFYIKNFKKKNISYFKEELEIEFESRIFYYLFFISVYLREYFKIEKTLNIEAFKNFNCRGFKEELKNSYYYEMKVEGYDDFKTALMKLAKGSDFFPEEECSLDDETCDDISISILESRLLSLKNKIDKSCEEIKLSYDNEYDILSQDGEKITYIDIVRMVTDIENINIKSLQNRDLVSINNISKFLKLLTITILTLTPKKIILTDVLDVVERNVLAKHLKNIKEVYSLDLNILNINKEVT